jgi:hypothetical protein
MYSLKNVIRVAKSMRTSWAGHTAFMGEMKNGYNILFGKLEEKRSFWRLRRRWEDNIKVDLKEILCQGVDCIQLGLDSSNLREVQRWTLLNTAKKPMSYIKGKKITD